MLSASFALRVPVGNPPDETAHRDYIRLLVETRSFVKFIPRGDLPPDAPTRDEAHQPPLYYLLCAPVYAATNGNAVAVRFVSVLLQVATVALVCAACRDLFPARSEVAIGAAAFVAFLPTQAMLGGSINNDALSTLLCAAIWWRLGAVAVRGQTAKDAILLGVLFGAALWTKLSVVQLVPAFLVCYYLGARGGKFTAREAVLRCIVSLALGTLIASPWLIRNTVLYGDPLTLAIYRLTGPNFTPEQMMAPRGSNSIAQGWSLAQYLQLGAIRSFATFWYFIEPNATASPRLPLLVVLAVAVASWLALYQKIKTAAPGVIAAERAVLPFALAVPLLIPFYLKFVLSVYQMQGRYFLPALLPVAALTALAWSGDGDNKPAVYFRVLWVPLVLLALSVYELLGDGFVH